MRSYNQYCALAKALDVVGDRWTLLIVRELIIQGPCRYTDLRNGLPGVATNLLADRLRDLEEVGIVRREEAPPPVASTLVHLTERGRALWPAIRELGRWGGPLLAEPGAGEDEEFRTHWLAVPTWLHLVDRRPKDKPIAIEVRSGQDAMVIETEGGEVRTRAGRAEAPDAVIISPPKPFLGLITGRLDLAQAEERGLRYEGDATALTRVLPDRAQSTSRRTA
jgi:DNA-binding HxlR family transcriptional regulator